MLIVVGGHSRNVGKTSVVAGLIAALPELRWTAAKITQYGHGICSANGKQCHCATSDHVWAISQEHDRSGESDTSRFLIAGAEKVFWVRTEQGKLSLAMPGLQAKIRDAAHVILESNSVMEFLRPDLYLTVVDPRTADFKTSARKYLDRADGVLLHGSEEDLTSQEFPSNVKIFRICPPQYITAEVVEFVRLAIGERVPRQTAV